jgi:radical SAM protein with 4Fe4S-binding SPASM domain
LKEQGKKRQHDGTKLLWHMDRVIDYYDKKKKIVPIHIDCGITKKCNMSCTYCYGKMQNMTGAVITEDALLNNLIRSAAKIGVKSLGFIGDGEPTLNPACFEGLRLGKELGLDMAMSTNGILLETHEKMKITLESCTWMRFNISAYTADGYRNIHKSSKRDDVFDNLRKLVKLQNKLGTKCDIGIQMVFDPASMLSEVIPLARFAVDAGVNYFVIKQCSLPDDGETGIKQFDLNMYTDEDVVDVLKQAEKMSTVNTQIIPKWNIMGLKGDKPYERCLSVPLLSELSGDGGLYPCGHFFGGNRPELEFGNVHNNTLEEIVNSDNYWKIIKYLETELEVGVDCKGACRQESTNIFIDNYVNKPSGINFI